MSWIVISVSKDLVVSSGRPYPVVRVDGNRHAIIIRRRTLRYSHTIRIHVPDATHIALLRVINHARENLVQTGNERPTKRLQHLRRRRHNDLRTPTRAHSVGDVRNLLCVLQHILLERGNRWGNGGEIAAVRLPSPGLQNPTSVRVGGPGGAYCLNATLTHSADERLQTLAAAGLLDDA